jgi:MATE family multidrug resistance protein
MTGDWTMTTHPNDRETLVASDRPLSPGGTREVLRLALPSMVAFSSNVIMNIADTILVAGVGDGAVKSVVTSALLFHVVAAFFGGMVSTVTTFTSQSFGRGDAREGARYAWQGIHIGLVVGVVFCLTVPLLPGFFALIGDTPEVQRMETEFSSFRVLSLLFVIVSGSIQGFFQGLGRTKIILLVMIVANVANVLFNWLLVYGVGPIPAMGVSGSGLGTLLACMLGAGLYLGLFLGGRASRECGTRQAVAASWPRLKRLLRLGVPTSVQFSLDVLAWAVWNIFVGRLGVAAGDANGVVMQIIQMAWFPAIGLGQAACSLVGWYIARGREDRVRKSVRTTLGLASLYMLALSAVMLLAAEPLVRFFFIFRTEDAAAATSQAEVIALAVTATRIAAVWQLFDGLGIVLMSSLRGAGDTLWPALAMTILSWGFFLPLAYVLCFVAGWGMAGAWWAGVVHLGLLAGLLAWRYRGTAWLKRDIFHSPGELSTTAGIDADDSRLVE